jgi:hypothetical protein
LRKNAHLVRTEGMEELMKGSRHWPGLHLCKGQPSSKFTWLPYLPPGVLGTRTAAGAECGAESLEAATSHSLNPMFRVFL